MIKKRIKLSLLSVLSLILLVNPIVVSALNNSITVNDTTLGNSVNFVLSAQVRESINEKKSILVLVTPSNKKYKLNFSGNSANGTISAKNLSVPGTYKLASVTSNSGTLKVAAIDSFVIKDSRVILSADDRFEFKNFPATVKPFQDITFTLVALNSALSKDVNYKGTVEFVVDTDENAKLPTDYTFVTDDAGEHVFTDAIYFSEIGNHTLVVKDKSNASILGSFEVTVSDSATSTQTGLMNITSPISGNSTVNILTFSGTVDPGLEVRILDKGTILGSTNADATGRFSYVSPVLADGAHVFKIQTDTAASDDISVNISTTGNILSSLKFTNNEVAMAGTTEATATFRSAAKSVVVTINGVKFNLQKADNAGLIFKGNVTAPSVPGTYDIDLSLVTDLGVNVNLVKVTNLIVTDGFGLGTVNSAITFNVPSQVLNIKAESGDKRVTLNWDPSTDDTGIKNYYIEFGIDILDLSQSVSTQGNSTTWYVPSLENGTRYYFRVYGVDTEGNKGDQPSMIISAIPGVAGSTTLHGSADGQVVVDNTANTGPENVVLILLVSFIIAFVYRNFKLS